MKSVLIMGHFFCYAISIKRKNIRMEGIYMKGFTTSTGYMGWVEDRYILFASEYDYREYMEEA